MKRTLSVILALMMLLTVFAPAAAAAPTQGASWNAEKLTFTLKDPPILTGIREDSNVAGTNIYAYFRLGDEAKRLMDEYEAADRDDDMMYARTLGMDEEDVEADFDLYVQIAYSFDGANWVYDWDTDEDPDDLAYYPRPDFDFDGDGFNEFCNMPSLGLTYGRYYYEADVVTGRQSCFEAQYCNDDIYAMKEAIRRCNEAMLQGKGEYLGSYQRDQDDSGYGMAIDLNSNTVYVKARYRVYQWMNRKVGDDWIETGRSVAYSDWSAPMSYNKSTAPALPELTALKTDEPLTLEALERYTETKERDGVDVKVTRYRMAVRFPAAMDAALGSFFALDDNREVRRDHTGEWYDPDIVIEMKVGGGDWYYLTDISPYQPYFEFSDDIYWMREEMEALGYQPNDPVYLRARLYGDDSWKTERDDTVGYDKAVEKEPVKIRSGLSNVVEMNLTGKFTVTYELNDGSFLSGTTQVSQFDEDSDFTVDLTAPDYTPERRHFVFKGWFADEALTKPITSFNTDAKMSRTYYAKWEELPYHTLTYDTGIVTGSLYNPNPERIYPDSGEEQNGVLTLENVSCEGVEFLGWYDAKEGGSKVETLKWSEMTGDKTLYAHWNLPTYTITYTGAGTDYLNNEKNPAAFQADPSGQTDVLIYAPSKKGSIFDGWFLKENFEDGLSREADADVWHLHEGRNVTLYAKWILGRWNINYVLDLDNVWNGANPETYTYGTAVALKDPSRTGYTFEGWFTDKACTNRIETVAADSEGEITVYAKWTAIQYTIKYDLRDPDAEKCFENVNPTVRGIDDEVALKPLAPVTKLYKFIGWFDNVNFDGEPVTKIAAGTDKNITLYAKIQTYKWGDIDLDGSVTASDARLLLRRAVGLEDPEFTDDLIPWGDFDNDGQITASDARTALRMAVGLDTVESLGLPEYPAGI